MEPFTDMLADLETWELVAGGVVAFAGATVVTMAINNIVGEIRRRRGGR